MNYTKIINDIVSRESKEFTNDPNDDGGPTKYGITLKTLKEWRKNDNLTAKDVEKLTEDEAKEIYSQEYIFKHKFNLIPNDNLQECLIDFGVTSGQKTAIKRLQKALNVKADGIIGPQTLVVIKKNGYIQCLDILIDERILFYAECVRSDPDDSKYIVGWCKRALSFRKRNIV